MKNPNDLTTPDLKRPLVKATVNTFKKAISFKNDLFSDGSSGDPDVILDPFEFRCVARVFLTIRPAQRGQIQAGSAQQT